MKILITFAISLLLIAHFHESVAQSKTSTFNKSWLKAIASIEIENHGAFFPIGTGFISATPGGHIALVTAKHVVFDENGKIIPNIIYRLNEHHTTSRPYPANYPPKYVDNLGWFFSEKYDLSCRFLVYSDSADFVEIDSTDYLGVDSLDAGANVLVIGFPLGLRSEKYANPLVRHGIVSRADSSEILVDAFVFPGNSGGPVLYLPTIKIGGGLLSPFINSERIIGLVSGYVPYEDVAISNQTRRPRVVFEENSGLCVVVPIIALTEVFQSAKFQAVDHQLYKYR